MEDLEHFGLDERPFNIAPDPRFLYLSDQVKEAIAKCEYMARNRVGPLYMYGPIGSGKTSLLKRLRQELSADERYTVSTVISPNIKTANAFLRVIMDEFGVKTARAYDRSLRNFEEFLVAEYEDGRIPVLLVDEAQFMVRDTLRLIHYLLNFETSQAKLVQIVLAGQEELATKILRFQELASRMFPIAINGMSRDDLKEMISFRWMVAGGKEPPLPDEAYDVVFAYSKGLPRDAIKICGEALRYMAARDQSVISVPDLENLAQGLNLQQ